LPFSTLPVSSAFAVISQQFRLFSVPAILLFFSLILELFVFLAQFSTRPIFVLLLPFSLLLQLIFAYLPEFF